MIVAFVIAMGVALLVTPIVISFAKRTGALDKPDVRKVHQSPVPRIGGVGIYIAFILGLAAALIIGDIYLDYEAWMELAGLIVGGSMIVGLGILDDYKDLPARVKLVGQIVAAAVTVVVFDVCIDVVTSPLGGYIYLEYLAIPATIFWIVGLTNTVNLIDGLDGLAAGVASIAAVTIFMVAMEQGLVLVALVTAALAGSALGFLYYNFNPARIFMGDTGSMFLGFILAGASVAGAVKSATTVALVVPILALGLPILDTTFAIVRRARNHTPIFKPDKGHLHHRLLSHGFTQRQAVLLMYVVSALFGLCAITIAEVSPIVGMGIVTVLAVAALLGAKKLGIFNTESAK